VFDLKQSFQQETDKYEFNQKEFEQEVSHFKFVVVKQEDELQQFHKQTDKLQKQLAIIALAFVSPYASYAFHFS
jgi:hypothetical protein